MAALPAHSADADPAEVRWRVAERAKNDDLADRMKKDLKLSPDQDVVVRRALEEKTQQTSALRQEFRTRLQALSTATDDKITASLSDDQKKQYAALKEREERKAIEESKRSASDDDKGKARDRDGRGFDAPRVTGDERGGHGGGF